MDAQARRRSELTATVLLVTLGVFTVSTSGAAAVSRAPCNQCQRRAVAP